MRVELWCFPFDVYAVESIHKNELEGATTNEDKKSGVQPISGYQEGRVQNKYMFVERVHSPVLHFWWPPFDDTTTSKHNIILCG